MKLDDAHFAGAELEQLLTLAEQWDDCVRALRSRSASASAMPRRQWRHAPNTSSGTSSTWPASTPYENSHGRLDAPEQALRGQINDGIEPQTDPRTRQQAKVGATWMTSRFARPAGRGI
jgi:hypothetical protein